MRSVETEQTVEQQLLRHAERQTRALENINVLVTILLIAAVLGAGIWAIVAAVS